jgi:hypothetical protein
VADRLRAALLAWLERVGERPAKVLAAPARPLRAQRREDPEVRGLPWDGLPFGHQTGGGAE